MVSTIVIKVKHGETHRRFNARVVNGELELGLDNLREKVLGLFNFAPDGYVTLTYIDEDGDIITLADEEDLRDVMRQSLNPLRINVRLNSEKGGRHYGRSSGSSTPMRAPRVQHTIQNLNADVSEILNSVLEPIREAISKLSIDLASNATSTAPGFAELVGSLSKMGFSFPSPVSEFQTGAKSSTQCGDSEKTIGESASKGPEASKVDEGTSVGLPSAKSEAPSLENNQMLPNTISKHPTVENNKMHLENTVRGVEATGMPTPGGLASVTLSNGSLYLNGDLPGDNSLFEGSASNPAPGVFPVAAGSKSEEVKKLAECNSSGKSDALAFVNGMPAATKGPAGDKNKEIKKSNDSHFRQKFVGCGASSCSYNFLKHSRADFQNTDLSGGSDWGNSSASYVGLNPINECPFSGMPLTNDSAVLPSQYAAHLVPFKRSHNHGDGMDRIFHRGIRCDGCGVHPITGPRFKSLVTEDYDLCSMCVTILGNDADYITIDRPVMFRHPLKLKVDASFKDPIYERFNGLNLNLPPVSHGITGPEIASSNVEPKVEDNMPVPDNSHEVTEMVEPIIDEHPGKEHELNFPTNYTFLGGGVSCPVLPWPPSMVSHPIINFSEAPPVPLCAPLPATDAQVSSARVAGENNDVEQTLLRELGETGFMLVDLNKEILKANEYHLEQSVDNLCGFPNWDPILKELEEMGFHDNELNMWLLLKNKGSIKRVVMDLVAIQKA